jgi:flagellar hook-associated protein 3 FlgL
MSRITQYAMTQNSLAGLQANLQRTQQLQSQISSGKRVQVPSDDPAAALASVKLRSEESATTQYLKNADTASSRLNVADATLQSLSSQLQLVQQAAIRSHSGALSDNARAALGQQITQLKSEVIGSFNAQYLGRPIFGGTVAGQVALDSTGAYVGDGNPVSIRVSPTTSVRVDVDGQAVGADSVPALLDRLAASAAQGTVSDADLNELSTALSNVSAANTVIGVAQQAVTTSTNQLSSRQVDITGSILKNEGADIAETLVNLASQQVAYEAALSVTAKINSLSLLDFLR